MVLKNEGYGQSVDWLTLDNNRGILTPGKKFTIKVQANDQSWIRMKAQLTYICSQMILKTLQSDQSDG